MNWLNSKRTPFVSYFLFSLGVILLSLYWWLLKQTPKKIAFERQPVLSANISVYPQKIKIDSLMIDLPVTAVKLESDNWPLLDNQASYLIGSGQIGKKGNPVIYGHNLPNVFGKLKKIKLGDLITVTDAENQVWHYRVEKVLIVSPKEVGVLSTSEEPILTVYTCFGFWDQQRLVVISRRQD